MSDAPTRVLIIEDDENVAELLEEILRQHGYDPSVAADGLQGLLKLQTGGTDVALLDIMMPDVNGVRVLQQLLEENGGALPLPIIVITGSPEGARRAAEVLGRENVFEKPFDPDQLIARVDAVSGGA